ncbi:putative H /K ATPase alpha subunit [Mariannaea sp. PMI_226]|nr:putative H /K ATPase alpha subunit [Mariannaea sp. PMI_226]
MPLPQSLRWREGDEEDARSRRKTHSDIDTNTEDVSEARKRSLSRHRRLIDPGTTLPIQYRSVSIDVEEGQRQEQTRGAEARDVIVSKLEHIEWHKLSIVEAQKRFGVDVANGLSAQEAQERVQKYGENKISPLPSPWFWKVFGYFFGGFGSILFVGGILVFISWKPLGDPPAVANLALGIVLIAVFLIQAAFNGWQDWSSSRVMNSITAMLPESSIVLRDGVQTEIDAANIVPGDVIFIKPGNRIPADVRFIEVSSDASIDRAVLTGESKPIKSTVDSTDDNYLETHCIGLQGTHCVSGNALGIVVSTGDETVFGQIAKLTGEPKTGLTTIEKEIIRFVVLIFLIMISWIIILAAVWGGWLHKAHPDWINVPTLIVSCVSVAIAYIPEGLPISVTASLTITANLMRNNKILCKSLKTVETLGAVSVICSDKTGTLTRNKMFVTNWSLGTTAFSIEEAEKEDTLKSGSSGVQQARAIAGLCNAAEFDKESLNLPISERHIFGDATDQAALRFAESIGPTSDLRDACKTIFELAFNSKTKFMSKVFCITGSQAAGICLSPEELAAFNRDKTLVTVKGAPDILLQRCSSIIMPDGKKERLTSEALSEVTKMKNEWSSQGRRVILLARKVLDEDKILPDPNSTEMETFVKNEVQSGLTLVSMLALVDLPRVEIPEVVQTLRGAGIRLFMVTGDFGLTALSIARQCNIVTQNIVHDASALVRFPSPGESTQRPVPSASLLLTGSDLMTLNDYQWEQLCEYPEIVFSRTTPDQKLRIVREFQARDQIVGMTGDGVNDAPALKAADIGISLSSGSDIAIEAADMVLLDSFGAIVEAVRYGRVVFDNLKKIIAYLLPAGSFSEFWPVFTNVVLGLPQILSSFLMIIICCFTDCSAAIVLAYEKPEADVLLRPPRNPKKTRLVNWQLMFHAYAFIGVIETVLSFTMAYWYLERKGIAFKDLWFKFGDIPSHIDPDYYQARLNEASSIYFINLVVMQWFNLMSVRTRHLSIFQHPPILNKETQNVLLFPAIFFSLGIAVIWLYIPALQKTLDTAGPPAVHYFIPMALGFGLLCLDEGRKACVRRWPNGLLAKMAW